MKQKLIMNPLKTRVNRLGSNFNFNNEKISSNLYIVRHAESKFNHAIKSLENSKNSFDANEYKLKKNKIRFNREFLDSDITDKGISQCYEAGQILKNTNIKYVFVSPLRRCLKTLQNVLYSLNLDNPKQIRPEIIVHPILFEKVEDSCDLLNDINSNMEEFSQYNWELFKKIDHPNIYQLKYLDNYYKSDTNSYYQRAIDNYNQFKTYGHHDFILREMELLVEENKYIESSKCTFDRLNHLKDFIKDFTNNNNKYDDILIVGHSILFHHLTTKYINDSDFTPGPNEIVLKNCEVANITFDY